jgi:hypothetical protein
MFKIYALKLVDSNEYRYIGRTKEKLNLRLSKHKTNAKLSKKKTHRCRWILKNIENIEIVLIETVETFEESCEREVYYISYYREIFNLTNTTNGGDGGCPGYKHTKEALEKISKTHKGKKLSEETKQKISNRIISDETRKIISEKLKGVMKGEKNPMYGKKRPDTSELNRQRTGWKHSEKSIKLFSESRKGDKHVNCKIKSKEREEIYNLYKSKTYNITELSNIYSVCKGTITRIIREMKMEMDKNNEINYTSGAAHSVDIHDGKKTKDDDTFEEEVVQDFISDLGKYEK